MQWYDKLASLSLEAYVATVVHPHTRGGSGIKEVVWLTIIAHCGRRCLEGALGVGRGVKC